MSVFFTVVPVAEAVKAARSIGVPAGMELVPLCDSPGRILGQDIRSDIDIPGFTRSVVDGYAVRAADTSGSSDAVPAFLSLAGRVAMGADEERAVTPGSCVYVPTGGILPAGADAVVMIENAGTAGGDVMVRKPVAHGENVLLANEDFRKGEVVLRCGRKISAQDTGVLAAAGCTSVPVSKKPRIAILSTGNELIPASGIPARGQVRDVNSYVIASFVQGQGCIPVRYGIIRDDRAALGSAMKKAAAECDAVLISGGSSKDERDMVAAVIGGEGEVLVHGVAIAPGKPTIIGKFSGKPVIGLPGHPAAAVVVLVAIGSRLIASMTGESESSIRTTGAVLAENVPSTRGREDYVRVVVNDGIATPLFGKSGLLNTLVRSTGLVRIPAESEGLETGARVEVILW
ncbi:MAG TPA: gephyrin-like molybdotransferase Glp [Methanoregula sp.]|nr:gephyrin-like molybdotransferase Glp [Methanoregula sp.]